MDAHTIAEKLSKDQRYAVEGSSLMVSGRMRVHWNYAGPVMRSLTALGILGEDSSYLTPLGLEVRNILLNGEGK